MLQGAHVTTRNSLIVGEGDRKISSLVHHFSYYCLGRGWRSNKIVLRLVMGWGVLKTVSKLVRKSA